MIKLLVSACLMGEHVRYNGGAVKILDRRLLECWQGQDRVVLFCPEVAGGLMV
ncbi:2-thiouracil desulfurase family protein, partial [Thermodesulfobacteriota bacterium]